MWKPAVRGLRWESSFSSLLKVSVTKEHPFGGTKATKQPYKVSVFVAVSLPRVVNHSVCRQGGLCCLCTIYNHFKAVGGERQSGGGRVLSLFQWLMVNLKGSSLWHPVQPLCWTGKCGQAARLSSGRWERVFTFTPSKDASGVPFWWMTCCGASPHLSCGERPFWPPEVQTPVHRCYSSHSWLLGVLTQGPSVCRATLACGAQMSDQTSMGAQRPLITH